MINRLLAELVQPVQGDIGEVSPWIGFLERIDPSADDAIINFSLDLRARYCSGHYLSSRRLRIIFSKAGL